ncbi:MAG TPA: hypothetical protein VG389_14295 [Myxococcota bacterium]|jgi:hypothetical protein|nr:hypothetical protein [Myxococcota bacterium]
MGLALATLLAAGALVPHVHAPSGLAPAAADICLACSAGVHFADAPAPVHAVAGPAPLVEPLAPRATHGPFPGHRPAPQSRGPPRAV